MTTDEIQSRISDLRRQIQTLEWDKRLNQINPAKLDKLEILKKEIESILNKSDNDSEIL